MGVSVPYLVASEYHPRGTPLSVDAWTQFVDHSEDSSDGDTARTKMCLWSRLPLHTTSSHMFVGWHPENCVDKWTGSCGILHRGCYTSVVIQWHALVNDCILWQTMSSAFVAGSRNLHHVLNHEYFKSRIRSPCGPST